VTSVESLLGKVGNRSRPCSQVESTTGPPRAWVTLMDWRSPRMEAVQRHRALPRRRGRYFCKCLCRPFFMTTIRSLSGRFADVKRKVHSTNAFVGYNRFWKTTNGLVDNLRMRRKTDLSSSNRRWHPNPVCGRKRVFPTERDLVDESEFVEEGQSLDSSFLETTLRVRTVWGFPDPAEGQSRSVADRHPL
jgi:hypothetical protein